MSETVMTYVAVNAAGNAVAIIVDLPNMKRQVAKDVSRWIREGYAVRHMPLDEGRNFFASTFQVPASPATEPQGQPAGMQMREAPEGTGVTSANVTTGEPSGADDMPDFLRR